MFAFARHQRDGQPFAIIFFDIDRFKAINDTYRHQAGDSVLRQIARVTAIGAGPDEFPVRYGGEEFLLISAATTQEKALERAETLRATIARHLFILPNSMVITVSISIGVAIAPAHGTSSETLLYAADDAHYSAKAGGRDCVRLASNAVEELGEELRAIEQRERERTAPR